MDVDDRLGVPDIPGYLQKPEFSRERISRALSHASIRSDRYLDLFWGNLRGDGATLSQSPFHVAKAQVLRTYAERDNESGEPVR